MSDVRHPVSIDVTRRSERFGPEHTRVITKFFRPGGSARIRRVLDRIMELDDEAVHRELDAVLNHFAHRHRNFQRSLGRNFEKVRGYLPEGVALSEERILLIGAYFTHEYSISAAAMFNPSIVPAPDQEGLPPQTLRFIMSFRAVGEGHISSIEFRSGTISEGEGGKSDITFDPISPYLEIPEVITDDRFEKRLFAMKIDEMGADNEVSAAVLGQLGDEFTMRELEEAIRSIKRVRILPRTAQREATEAVLWLARSNYTIRFPSEHEISERVIFPVSENESRGIEDARFVRFVEEDGQAIYYATYTAYNGFRILPQLIETRDFITFKVLTLNGPSAADKGMALFPRRINGLYAMIGRQDGENLYMMYSDNIHFWHERRLLQTPRRPWELIQIGNNGSPLETEAGWLLLTHGVGPMREYVMGCTLLDLEHPERIIGSLDVPLLSPNVEEREGYVPNVVYSCGAMLHGNRVVIPYAMSDSFSGIATVPLDELLERLTDRSAAADVERT